jgi:hypothetical protein
MKLYAMLLLVLASSTAGAMPVLDCKNKATGAEMHIGVYGNQPPFYTLSTGLANNLQQQVHATVATQGSGGTLKMGRDFSFAVKAPTGYLSVASEGGGFRVRYSIYSGGAMSPNFYFNEGDCRNSL